MIVPNKILGALGASMLLLAGIVTGQSPFRWATPTVATSAGLAPRMAFDPGSGTAILLGRLRVNTQTWNGIAWRVFGGHPGPGLETELAFDGDAVIAVVSGTTSRWVPINWQTAPATTPNYAGFRMAHDEARGQVLGFGGLSAPFTPSDETWVWNGTSWRLLSPQTAPPGRAHHAMAFDRASGRIVLFGGELTPPPNRAVAGDTWTWDGADWVQETSLGPPARHHATLVGPEPVLLHGGTDSFDQPLGDLWRWDGLGLGWESVQAGGMTQPRSHHAATLFDGEQGPQMLVIESSAGAGNTLFQTLEIAQRHTRTIHVVAGHAQVAELVPPRVLGRADATPGRLPASGTEIAALGGTPQQGGASRLRVQPVVGGYRIRGNASAAGSVVESVATLTLDFAFSSPLPVPGAFLVQGRRSADAGESRATIEVDVRADGTTDFVSPAGVSRYLLQTLLGPSPVRVRVTAYVEVDTRFGQADQELDFTISFRETDAALLDTEGTPCGGTLDAAVHESAQRLQFSLRASGVTPTPFGFFVLGASNPQLPIPPTGCLLLTDTLIPILAPIPAGETSSELTFSLARQPGTFRVQHMHAVVGADGVARWFTSNAVRVTVP